MVRLALAASTALVIQCGAQADEHVLRLHGPFCNTENQIDRVVGYLHEMPPQAAMEKMNLDAVVCNYVDQIEYAVIHPIILGEIPDEVPLIKYEATLIGVVVGGVMRPVEPTAQVFFALREQLAGASVQGGA